MTDPTQDDIERLFPLDANKAMVNGVATFKPPQKGVFELGLVLGGTVSAGAFTAGVLDFLTEALDAWDMARENNDPLAPSTKVVLKTIGGASGGGVNTAILGRMVPFSFPHVSQPADATADTGNLFFEAWVNLLDINGMLECDDIGDDMPVQSLLNASVIDAAGTKLAGFPGVPLGQDALSPKSRRWLGDTLTMFMTLTNLRGVPYLVDFHGGAQSSAQLTQSFVQHSDYVRFEVDCRPGLTGALREDAYGLTNWPEARPAKGFTDWTTATKFAMATGAFPVGFKVRELARLTEHYLWRPVLVPGDGDSVPDKVVLLKPDWDAWRDRDGILQPFQNFPYVDGGVANNAPVELVRTALAGMAARNPRDGSQATRAVILIDPFADAPSMGPEFVDNVLQALTPLLQTTIAQSRYSTADLTLAADDSVFSRFMITGVRKDKDTGKVLVGGAALATAGLAGFQGFLCRDFRQHDFLLGRRNAFDFLASQLVFPANNDYFNADGAVWTDEQKKAHAALDENGAPVLDEKGTPCLRLIPLMGTAKTPPPLPDWPKGKLDADKLGDLRDKFDNRFKKVAHCAGDEFLPNELLRLLVGAFDGGIGGFLTGKVMDAIEKSLDDYKL